jgi:hypothetical protein
LSFARDISDEVWSIDLRGFEGRWRIEVWRREQAQGPHGRRSTAREMR